MDILTALTAASKGLEVLKALREIDKAVDVADWKAKLLQIQESLNDTKSALLDARDTLASKDAQIAKLTTAMKIFHDTVEYHGFRYAKKEDGTPKGIAFCSVCIVKDGTFINLAKVNLDKGLAHVCPRCKSNFGRRVSRFAD